MRATGIVRRIDDLGRVVIPKEIRKTMRLRDGDALEIFTDADGEVIFKKYSPIGELSEFASQYAQAIYSAASIPIIISDNDRIVASSGVPKREVFDKKISPQVEALLEDRRSFTDGAEEDFYPIDGSSRKAAIVYPIIAAGDAVGSVIMLETENAEVGETEKKLTGVAASFLGKQMEN